jgi:hypothetical protein
MLVVARYNENVDWINEPHFIVQKDEHLPNQGRETSSYFWYIIENYDNLPDVCKFRQGNVHEHKINNFTTTSDHTGLPHDFKNLPIKEIAETLSLEIPDTLFFTAGAQFDVTREQILARPKAWYEKAYTVSMEIEKSPWAFERLWKYIFSL